MSRSPRKKKKDSALPIDEFGHGNLYLYIILLKQFLLSISVNIIVS